ncbi:MAG TPA: hypothetical protein VN843_28875 [Anaerolineales bacterium]|nr:hypothetical protein [Anaerolineales bacterium]
MKKIIVSTILALLILIVLASTKFAALSAPANPANRFAGSWAGTMSFTDDANRKENILVTIPSGCASGSICGDINNTTVSCQWELTLASVNGNVFEYTFSKTLSGECPALGGGTLTLQSDGTLMREHKTPDFTASGSLWFQRRTR